MTNKDLRALIERASPLPWEWATSNSWRRITTVNEYQPVITPTIHHRDRHPDIIATEPDKELLIAAVNMLPGLLDRIDELCKTQE